MRKILFRVMAAMIIVTLTSFTTSKETILKGKIIGLQDSCIVVGGILTPQTDTLRVNSDGIFNAQLTITEPKTDYVTLLNPKSGFKIYLEPGSQVECNIETYDTIMNQLDITRCRVDFSGDNADCNAFLNDEKKNYYVLQEAALNEALKNKMPFLEFKKLLGDKVEKVKKEVEKLSNPQFVKANKADYDQKYKTTLDYYGAFIPQRDDDYRAYLMSVDLNDLANIDKAGMYVKYYEQFEAPASTENVDIAYFHMLPQLFTNHAVVSELADRKVQEIISQAPRNLDEIYAVYKEIKKNDSIPSHIQEEFNRFSILSAGKKAIDFDMYDINGKKVMLSDFKGKAVYLDCWASWCGPCKVEIPNMEKLYEHYKNNPDIVLVSVSLDKTTQPWLKALAKDKPQWPQYIVKGEFSSKLCTTYSVTGIPRFMMFDKEGNVISLDAPRPSDKEIIRFIDNALKQ